MIICIHRYTFFGFKDDDIILFVTNGDSHHLDESVFNLRRVAFSFLADTPVPEGVSVNMRGPEKFVP